MLETLIIILVIFWVLGLTTAAVGPLVHVLLVIAIVLVLFRVLQGRDPL